MDLTVPGGMGGKETMERLSAEDPEAIAIVSSGNSTDPVMSGYEACGFRAVLGKPYRLNEASTLVTRVLAQKA